MAKPKWTIKPNEIVTTVAGDGRLTMKAPLYDNNAKQGTLIWSISPTRQMSVTLEQVAGAPPIDFGGGAWVKVV